MQLSEQEIVRREKLTKLRELGINPYPANLYPVDHSSKQIKENVKYYRTFESVVKSPCQEGRHSGTAAAAAKGRRSERGNDGATL